LKVAFRDTIWSVEHPLCRREPPSPRPSLTSRSTEHPLASPREQKNNGTPRGAAGSAWTSRSGAVAFVAGDRTGGSARPLSACARGALKRRRTLSGPAQRPGRVRPCPAPPRRTLPACASDRDREAETGRLAGLGGAAIKRGRADIVRARRLLPRQRPATQAANSRTIPGSRLLSATKCFPETCR
jgi:hypothetical protein